MNLRALTLYVSIFSLLMTAGCASRYQDLLRDRDMEIRELNGDLADIRAENANLLRREQAAQGRISELEARPVEASTRSNELDSLAAELPGVSVRYNKSGQLSLGIKSTVAFDSGSTKLKPAAERILRDVARVLLRDYPDRRLFIEGHTDSDPIQRTKDRFRSNRHLSVERADSVASFLIQACSIPDGSVAVVGFGPYDPLQPGSSDVAKANNRRVEIVLGEIL